MIKHNFIQKFRSNKIPEFMFIARPDSELEPCAAQLRPRWYVKPGERQPATGEREPCERGEGNLLKHPQDSV